MRQSGFVPVSWNERWQRALEAAGGPLSASQSQMVGKSSGPTVYLLLDMIFSDGQGAWNLKGNEGLRPLL